MGPEAGSRGVPPAVRKAWSADSQFSSARVRVGLAAQAVKVVREERPAPARNTTALAVTNAAVRIPPAPRAPAVIRRARAWEELGREARHRFPAGRPEGRVRHAVQGRRISRRNGKGR